jgi:hypothetical protein
MNVAVSNVVETDSGQVSSSLMASKPITSITADASGNTRKIY